MKTIKIFAFIAIAALAMTACNKEKGGKTPSKATVSIVGEWRSTTFEGAEAPFDIYVDFNEDGSYEMYQRIYTLNYERYDGTYAVSGNIVSGSYSDGQSWKCGYKSVFSNFRLEKVFLPLLYTLLLALLLISLHFQS